MKALFIGGTGTISLEIVKRCLSKGWEVTLLNRGHHSSLAPEGAEQLVCDISDEASAAEALKGRGFDVVAEFVAYHPADVERDIRLFSGKTKQYFFISTASAYRKPLSSPWITEGTPLANPFWAYSREKAACERVLNEAWREKGFPATIVRPSHTYCERGVPVCLHGRNGSFQVLERIRLGKKVVIPGDGLSLWTFTHSRDFAVAFTGLMGNPGAIGETYHITSDESLTWNQAYGIIADALGQELHAVHISSETLGALFPEWMGNLIGDKSNTVLFDNTKIKRAVPEFKATIRYDEGVREAVRYIYSHPERQIPDPEFDRWCDDVTAAYEKMAAALPKY